ncbi:MAG TPA: transketolase C-terminal domain-containing protein [Caulobacteraceae bacterium]|nr:transketolase C-terminal domain-containing protein [Caulobacteraceae bacterium]
MREITYSKALNEALDESLAEDEDVIVYGCDVGRWGGIFNITTGLQAKYGADRVFDSPISENVLVGAGVGAAVGGLRPVVELQFADFLLTAGDEVFFKAGMWRFMHGGAFTVPLVVRLPSGATGAGPEHSTCPEAYVMHSPGLLCCVPSTPADAKGLLKLAIRSDDPVMFFEHRRLYQTRGPIDDAAPVAPFGKAAVRREGRHVTIVAWQMMLNRALKAAEILAAEGLDVEVIDPRTLAPFDFETILASVKKTGACLVVEEGYRRLGVGAEIGARLFEEALPYLDRPFRRLAIPDVPIGSAPALVSRILPSEEQIVAAVREMAG